jgi:hypothetical protein
MELLPRPRTELRKIAFGLGLKLDEIPVKADDPGGERICRLIAERENQKED